MSGTKVLSNRIRVLRAEKKMTQKELAEKVGVSRQTIISTEKGNYTPSLILAFDIADVFNVRVDVVFQYEKTKENL
ncbi:helix-turn-helix transcriptional regulator [Cytobacillus gottheilii]|uniref:Helix-turn-helix transcriptional regulator n=1 Tax=Cytobacillus gottheilii TaxID=859144 RepID=A0ABX8FDC4_9BACI|nr:helix-turn-helix transcriptional regulator [Cytobacillus gottheilii]QVY62109.1 helix-turn-helix transcriptional regulator [Cytobacillus gottheilii]